MYVMRICVLERGGGGGGRALAHSSSLENGYTLSCSVLFFGAAFNVYNAPMFLEKLLSWYKIVTPFPDAKTTLHST